MNLEKYLLAVCLLLVGPLCWGADDALRIGSKRFTESYILAHVLAQTAQSATATAPATANGKAGKVEVLAGLGNTAIV